MLRINKPHASNVWEYKKAGRCYCNMLDNIVDALARVGPSNLWILSRLHVHIQAPHVKLDYYFVLLYNMFSCLSLKNCNLKKKGFAKFLKIVWNFKYSTPYKNYISKFWTLQKYPVKKRNEILQVGRENQCRMLNSWNWNIIQ